MQRVTNSDDLAPEMINLPKPTTVAQCHEVIDALGLQVEFLRGQVISQSQVLAVLQERLKLDSKNSSKPPSSDGPASGNRAQRRASLRKRGAQVGHKGSFRALLDETQVDEITHCRPAEVCDCGAAVVALAEEPIRHQVFDVPPPVKAQVQEYRRYAGRCTGCGKAHRAALPAGVPSGQIGPRALALIGTLGTHYHLTQYKIRDLLARLTGVDFSVGAVSQAHGKVAQALAAPLTQIAAYVVQAPVKQMDETRYPREGGSNWAWTVVTPEVVWLSLLPSRARYVATSLVGEQFSGILVSDRYAVYDYVDADKRQVCWAHLLRDFTRIGARAGQAGQVGRGLLGAGYVLFRWRKQGKTSAAQFDPLRRRIKRLLEQGRTQTQCTRTANTCANLINIWPALWNFVDNGTVPPTNNDAERALRPLVLKRKISGPTRSRRGVEFLARGFSVYETCRRQGRDLWDYMHAATLAWIDNTAAPSLWPAAPKNGVLAPSG